MMTTATLDHPQIKPLDQLCINTIRTLAMGAHGPKRLAIYFRGLIPQDPPHPKNAAPTFTKVLHV